MSDPVLELIEKGKPKGVLVGVLSGELSRFSTFFQSLLSVMATLPPGSGLTWAKGVDICGACNSIIRHMVQNDHEYVWMMGDDHAFESDIVKRLMAHDVDVIVPHCLKRYPPWHPVVYSHQNEEGWYVKADLPEKGLTKIHAAGSAGMLIKRRVIEALADPWFDPSPDAAGLNEDLHFCQKVREAGFDIYCDPQVPLGHISVHTVLPIWADGAWHTQVNHDDTIRVTYRSDWIMEGAAVDAA